MKYNLRYLWECTFRRKCVTSVQNKNIVNCMQTLLLCRFKFKLYYHTRSDIL